MTLALLCAASLLAGFIDAVVGGGGLVQIPALLLLLPQVAVPTVLGTNKVASLAGTSSAAWRYSRHVKIDWHVAGPAAAVAFFAALLGAYIVTLVRPDFLRPLVLVLLVAVAIYVFLMKDLGLVHAPKHAPRRAALLGSATGLVLGFYDGFFGPGAGSFLIFAFVGVFGFNFLAASACAKLINLATNLGSLLYFAATKHVFWQAALPMAVCNVAGSLLGTRVAILKGSGFVRIFFLLIVGALIVRVAQQMFWR